MEGEGWVVGADILPLRPSSDDLDRAWHAYDDAQLRLTDLYRDATSTLTERRAKAEECIRLWSEFARMYERAGRQ